MTSPTTTTATTTTAGATAEAGAAIVESPSPPRPQTESQRIYWQQWLLASGSAGASSRQGQRQNPRNQHQRQLITSSAAVRIDRQAAKCSDVTCLLRKTLHLGTATTSGSGSGSNDNDALVLVGTVHNLPSDYVDFEHEVIYPDIVTMVRRTSPSSSPLGEEDDGNGRDDDDGNNNNNNWTAAAYVSASSDASDGDASEPFHVVKTLQPDDSPLQKRDELLKFIQRKIIAPVAVHNRSGTEITVSTQFYFVPSQLPSASSSGSHAGTTIPACVELDGYVTSMDEKESDHEDETDHFDDSCYDNDGDSFEGSDEGEEEMEDEIYMLGAIDGIPTSEKRRRGRWQSQWQQHRQQPEESGFVPTLLPLSRCMSHTNTTATTTTNSSSFDSPSQRRQKERSKRRQKQQRRSMRRYLQISQSHASPTCLSGYVLKQSTKDKHVWKRVYCVLTDDYLWFVPRLQTYDTQRKKKVVMIKEKSVCEDLEALNGDNDYDDDDMIKMAPYHGRIMLSRALLIESMEDIEGSSLFRIPNSWEVVTGKGVTHTFRVQSPSLARQWIQAIRQRLLECYEQSLLQNAELILTDEVVARNHRVRSVAVDPMIAKWAEQRHFHQDNEEKEENETLSVPTENDHRRPFPRLLHCLSGHSKEQFQASVIRLGMDIASYKEQCLHLQALLLSQAGQGVNDSTALSAVDSATLSQEIWENASQLLDRATDISSQVKVIVGPGMNLRGGSSSMVSLTSLESSSSSVDGRPVNDQTGHLVSHHSHSSRSLGTLCRHVEYIITGQFRHGDYANDNKNGVHDSKIDDSSFTSGDGRVRRPSCHNTSDPPPMDLFDMLLQELQTIAMR